MKLEGIFEGRTSIYMVTEFCDGGPILKKKIQYNLPTKDDEVIYILKQLLNGVTYLHKSGVIHRDLKPDNIMWKYKNKPFHQNQVVIVDFGLAEKYNNTDYILSKCGTPGYMAPEVIKRPSTMTGHKIDPACDIFSVGVILFQALTGKKPFRGGDKKETIQLNYDCFYDYPDNL
jgi:serine/threonine protein kinase